MWNSFFFFNLDFRNLTAPPGADKGHDGKSSTDNLVPKYKNVLTAIRQIVQEEGFPGLYKGFSVTIISSSIASSLFFSIYEHRKKALGVDSKSKQNMFDVFSASVQAGMLVSVLTQPMWVIKTRMLLNTEAHANQLSNLTLKIKEINSQYGFKGFYKGLSMNLILSFSGAVQMLVYEGSKLLYDRLDIPQTESFMEKNFVCGGLAKVGNVLFSYPFTTVRTRIQQNQYLRTHSHEEKYHGYWEIIQRTMKDEGLKGFYKGLSANILRGIPDRAIYFYFYEHIKKLLVQGKIH